MIKPQYDRAHDQSVPELERYAILFQREAAEASQECRKYIQVWKEEGYSSIEGIIYMAQLAKASRSYAAARALVHQMGCRP